MESAEYFLDSGLPARVTFETHFSFSYIVLFFLCGCEEIVTPKNVSIFVRKRLPDSCYAGSDEYTVSIENGSCGEIPVGGVEQKGLSSQSAWWCLAGG